MTAYLFGPRLVSGTIVAQEGKPFHIDGRRKPRSRYVFVDDRPPLPWLAAPDHILAQILAQIQSSQGPEDHETKLSIADLNDFPKCVGKKKD